MYKFMLALLQLAGIISEVVFLALFVYYTPWTFTKLVLQLIGLTAVVVVGFFGTMKHGWFWTWRK